MENYDNNTQITQINNVTENTSPTIHMDPNNPKILDLGYYSCISRLSNLCLFAGIWTMVMGVVELIGGNSDVWGKVLTTVSNVCFLLLCIYAYTAIRKRKPNAMFYARFIMATCVLSWVVLVASGGFELTGGNIFFGIGTLIYGSLGLYWSFADDEVKEVFPKEYRKTSWKDYLFCFGCVLLPFILAGLFIAFALGMSHFQAPNNLKEATSIINNSCPAYQGFGILSSVEYENNAVQFDYLLDESVVNMNSVQQNKDKWALLIVSRFATMADWAPFLEEMVKAKADMKVLLRGNLTGNKYESICNTKTINECLNKYSESDDLASLQVEVAFHKLALPSFVDENTILSDEYIKDNTLHYVYDLKNTVQEDVNLKYLKHCSLLTMRYAPNMQNNYALSLLARLNYGMQYHYKIDGKSIGSFLITPSEVISCLNAPQLTESEFLQQYFEITVTKVNEDEVPVEVDQGLTLKSLELDNVCLIYNYSVDENLIRLDVIRENKKELKESLLEFDLQSELGGLCLSCRKGISYHFIGNRSKKTVVIDCPFYEINSLLNK